MLRFIHSYPSQSTLTNLSARSPRIASFSVSSLVRVKGGEAASSKKDPNPQRSRQGDEEGVKTDDVAATDAAFNPGMSVQDAAKGIEKETGDSMQSSPANSSASKPKGQGVSGATDDAK